MWESICLPLLGNDTVKENDRAFDMNDLAYTSFDTILYIEPRNMEQDGTPQIDEHLCPQSRSRVQGA